VRIAYTGEGDWIPHPTYQDGDASAFGWSSPEGSSTMATSPS